MEPITKVIIISWVLVVLTAMIDKPVFDSYIEKTGWAATIYGLWFGVTVIGTLMNIIRFIVQY